MQTKVNNSIKICVLSLEPISNVHSNGRTLKNMLHKFEKDDVLNIYVHGNPSFKSATFYKILEKSVIKSYPFLKPKIQQQIETNDTNNNSNSNIYHNRTNFKVLIREIVWSNRNVKKAILKIVRDYNPNVLFLYLGNNAFLINIALFLSSKLNLPLVSFNSENYYFKDYDYIAGKKHISLCHKLYRRKFRKSIEELYRSSKANIFLTEDLQKLYLSKFPSLVSNVVYNSSFLVDDNVNDSAQSKTEKYFYYSGNIGCGRLNELIKIGKWINELDSTYKLIVHTETTEPDLVNVLNSCSSIVNGGLVSYKQNIEESLKAYAILHVDGTDPYYAKHTINGFSTKISDCLACKNCFIIRTNKGSTIENYVKKYDCAYCCTNDDEMKAVLKSVIENPNERFKYIKNAYIVAKQNHSLETNSNKVYEIIKSIL